MEHTTQIVFLLALAIGHRFSLGLAPPNHGPYHPGPPDIFDPLNLMPHGDRHGIFDLFGPFRQRHNDFGNPGMHAPSSNHNGQVSNVKEDNIKVTAESSPLKVTFLPRVDNINSTVQKKDVNGQLERKEKKTPEGNNSTPIPQLLVNDDRTNENKTVVSKPDTEILKSEDNTSMPEKLRTQDSMQAGGTIVFPDDVDEVKSAHKGTSENLNKTTNSDTLNYIKNSDNNNIVFPEQVIPQVPTRVSNQVILTPTENSGQNNNNISPQNYIYQALPVTNDVFPNRTAVYTTADTGQGSLYTNVINTLPQNGGQPIITNSNNYYQDPSSVLPSNQYYLVPNQNGNNLNQNVGIVNNIPSNNIGVLQNPQNNLAVATLSVNPNSLGNNQPNYNGQQQLPLVNNVYSNNILQQVPTVSSGVTPYVYNQGNIFTQGNYNPIPNNNANIGEQFVPQNVGQTYYVPNNVQPNANTQQLYMISNGNQLNNNINNGQPLILNPQGSTVTSNLLNILPENTQKYMIVNLNQQNTPHNGQGNGLQNGQFVALVPHQGSNSALVNNNDQSTQIPIGNIVQPMLQNAANQLATNSNTNNPDIILMNTTPSNSVFLSNNGQNSFVNVGQTVYKLVPVSNGNSNQILSAVNLISTKDEEDLPHATGNNKT